MKKLAMLMLVLASVTSCARNYNGATAQNFTLGAVQMKIHRGMSQSAVAEALGSPNIVTKDSEGNVTWVYDKVGSEIDYHESGGGFWLVIAGASGSKGGATTSQKTLTAVVRFNADNRVDNVTYHSSKY